MIRDLYIKFQDKKYHNMHKRSALKTLNNIEKFKGKTDPKLIKLSDEYAKDVFGWKGYAPWLYVYSAFQGEFKEGWIPDNFYGKIVVPKLKGDYGKISEFKALTSSLFKSDCFPDLFYQVNGLWLTKENLIVTENAVKDVLNKGGNKHIFKDDNSSRGDGILVFNQELLNSDFNQVKKRGNGVIQSFIKQHSFFDEIMPNSVATLRLTTAIDSAGNVSLRACYLKVGRKTDTYVHVSSFIIMSINIETGKLNTNAYSGAWQPLIKHPDTNFVFENKTIPHFDKCVETVLELHKKVPFARIIGWDVVVDEGNKVKVMEWNGNHNGIKFNEAAHGPIFKGLGLENLR